jgi:hypothetical protein
MGAQFALRATPAFGEDADEKVEIFSSSLLLPQAGHVKSRSWEALKTSFSKFLPQSRHANSNKGIC